MSAESTHRSQRHRSLKSEPIKLAEVICQKSIESNRDALAGRMGRCVAQRRRRVTKKQLRPDWANKEVEGHMADAAMLAPTPLVATGSWTQPGKRRTCAPFLVTG